MGNYDNKPRHLLITGGVRSGKSRFAEEQAKLLGSQVIFLATAEAKDAEMGERIKKHRHQRSSQWLTIEEPLNITGPLQKYQDGYTIILDCLTLYLSNLYFHFETLYPASELEAAILEMFTELAGVIHNSKANLIIVTNEVGWGIVPENDIARRFRDLSGILNQKIAEACNEVQLLVCGIPLKIKGETDV